MRLRSSILAAAAALALSGFAQAQPGPGAGGTMPAPTIPPNTMPQTTTAPATGTSLKDVQTPKTTLRGARLQDAKGETIGEVKSVELTPDGKVAAVNADVGGKIVTLKADTLSYAQLTNTVISTQTRAEIAP
jgi:hypothetical protein